MTTKLKSLGFTASHVHLLLVAFALFSVLIVAKSDISIKALFVKADDNVEMLTYEGVRDEILAERGGVITPQTDAEAEAQFALLDRSLDNGQVLGESIGIGTIPPAEQIFSRDQLDLITLSIEETTKESVEKYSERLLNVESQESATSLMANLNSSDPEILNKTRDQAMEIISNLKSLTVPSELVDFHRYKMIYYQSLSSMASSFAQNTLDTNFENTSKIFFSITSKLEESKSKIQDQYQVVL